jgi:hypothetical protein
VSHPSARGRACEYRRRHRVGGLDAAKYPEQLDEFWISQNYHDRIEAATVRREVEAAGFKFSAESTLLADPADPHTAGVFDPSIRGRTDQFILKFRRPLG